jgi:CHASE3 domain sensor protein
VRSLRSVLALATFGLVLVTLVGFAISFELLSRANDGEIEELRQNDRRDVDADELFNALVDEEVGMRGYLVGGARELLEPYERGLAEEREIRTRLRTEIPGPAVPDLEARIDEWHRTIAEPQIHQREAGPLADVTASLLAGKTSFDRIRAAHAALEERLAAFNQAARDDNEHQQRVVPSATAERSSS